ncbi:putative poly RNA polymerase cid13 [Rosellinia necatrix]|uniref:polynucleotide adenylyltransferase n=1 Tax=Rosellinia necatrix TaxID=77044 RepID=A0A1W2TGB7_ROSNE|nr:putative poly RNA polymerase cid13 [Rosellinia necatrix]
MDGQPVAADSKQRYPAQHWTRSISSPTVPRLSTLQSANPPELTPAQCAAPVNLPFSFPQQTFEYQDKLRRYNDLIAPGRGGGLQTTSLPLIVSSQPVHAAARSRSLSKVSIKDSRARHSSQNCHGNRSNQSTTKADRVLITGKVTSSKMPTKKSDVAHGLPPKPKTAMSSHLPPHSSSVPSTPHQHARKFSFGSRDPSPNANQGHSPRSAYSETNSALPSLRPLPPRGGGCKYETGLKHSRRRIPYNIGTDPLQKLDLGSVRSKLSEDDERKLTTDMRELYDRLRPTDAIEAKRQRLVQKLEKLLNDAWPGHDIGVHLFGSSKNQLCSDDSDVDICIVTRWKELEGVCMLADLLAKHGMERVVCVSSAKVPIVKIWDPELELSCDMNVNNTLALENTRMIKTYVDIDDRVRPLAMIIKYWTRQRILNDAAFGGTLSSYTWICMIIAFLQLRQPPILPALHQRPHQRLSRQDGEIAAFADDVDSLRGFGENNKSTLGELLFEFFRFFAHEFDYSTTALSIRLGKLITKNEKKWHLAMNNQLCVEEPFNINRNLGNTADDTAFRGIHLELRRAFDALAQGNLEKCCEQYVYPKEEEKIFQRPPVSRPVLLRSASQQQPSRPSRNGNYRNNGRHQNRNNGNSHNANNRRASSILAYENSANPMFVQAPYNMVLGSQDGSTYMHTPDLMMIKAIQEANMKYLQDNNTKYIQDNSTKFKQYTQSPAFQQQALQQQVLQQQILQQQVLQQHAQRMQQSTTPQSQSSTERSRPGLVDTPPSAPMPDIIYWPVQPAFYPYPFYPFIQSNFISADRRSSHRSTVASETSHGPSGSTVRSHSQPASRAQNLGVPSQMHNAFPSVPAQHLNNIPIPSYIPDESNDNEQNGSVAGSPDDGHSSSYYSNSSPPRANEPSNGVPAFSDIGPQSDNPAHYQLQSNEFSHHTPGSTSTRSRSPSPSYQETLSQKSGSSAPLAVSSLPSKHFTRDNPPMVVNGSKPRPLTSNSSRQAEYAHLQATVASDQSAAPWKGNPLGPDRPVVVNGSRPTPGPTTPPQAGPCFTNDAVTLNPDGLLHVAAWPAGTVPISHPAPPVRLPAALQRLSRPVPSPLIAQLDLATETSLQVNDVHHLSPVYETKSPSPSFTRKLELPLGESSSRTVHSSQRRHEGPSDLNKSQLNALTESSTLDIEGSSYFNPRINGLIKENGHVRGVKSESENAVVNGAWQKPRGRKRVNEPKGRNDSFQSEQPPKNDADRKGG